MLKHFFAVVWIVFLVSLIVVTSRVVLSDNITVTQGIGTTIGTDVVTRNAISENQQIVKLALGPDGTHSGFALMGQQTMANSLAVVLPSDQSLGGGTEYDEGDTDATLTGKIMMWEDTGDTATAVSAAKPMPVSVSGVSTAANQTTIIGHVDGIEGLIGTTNTNTGASTTALQIIDDWDESDRAKVNLIAGQAGVAGGSGTVSALTQRVVLATDVGLPAGTSNIGDVDIASAIPAGNNNIGDVDVASIAAGNNNIGDVDVASIAAGNNNIGDVDIASAIPAGNNNIGDVDIASAIPAGNNNIGDVDVATLPALVAGTAQIGTVGVTAQAAGGWTPFRHLDVDVTGISIKASAGQIGGWYYICNRATTERFLKFYNDAGTPDETDTPVFTMPLAAGDAAKPTCANTGIPSGLVFSTGIAIRATTGIADADTGTTGANEVVVNLGFK